MKARNRFARLAIFLALAIGGPAVAEDVLAYHKDDARSGHYNVPGLTLAAARAIHLDPKFHARVPSNVYAQPLFFHSGSGRALLLVATESNDVVALDATSGALVWQHALGQPVPRSSLPCGNIDPDGITGTPVIGAGKLFLDALVQTAGGPRHLVFGLSLADGSVLSGYPIDIAAALAARHLPFGSDTQGERGALALLNGALYVPYGGNFGDCGSYRGTVVEIRMVQPKLTAVWQTRAKGGGIWTPAGLASDGSSLFAVTGNTFDAASYADGEAVIRLRPGLTHGNDPADFVAPADWQTLDGQDLDLGGTNAMVFDIGQAQRVLALGKDGKAYLADRTHLGGIGGALAVARVSNERIIGAPAFFEADGRVLVAFASRGSDRCRSSNLTMLSVTANKVDTLWCAPLAGRGGPIVTTTTAGNTDAIVWVTGAEGDNRLHGFEAMSGRPVVTAPAQMGGLHHMGTLIAAGGRLYVASDSTVYAYAFP